MAIPDERELDDWFDLEKTRLSDEFAQAIQRGENEEAAKGRFEKQFKALLARYDSRYTAADKARARRDRLLGPFRKAAGWWDARKAAFAAWSKERAERKKKEAFEREYKKLFSEKKKD